MAPHGPVCEGLTPAYRCTPAGCSHTSLLYSLLPAMLSTASHEHRHACSVVTACMSLNACRPGAAAAAAAANSSSGTGYFSGALRALRRRSQGTQSLLSDYSQNLWAAPKALTRPDHRLIANWQALACEPGSGSSTSGGGAAAGGGPQAAGKALRRHFAELTLAVLAPFKKYLQPADDGMVGSGRGRPRVHCCCSSSMV
jgi:hypothetical protein